MLIATSGGMLLVSRESVARAEQANPELYDLRLLSDAGKVPADDYARELTKTIDALAAQEGQS